MSRILTTLDELHDRGVRFVVVGQIAAQAHGATRLTSDLDICYDRDPDNLRRLASTLQEWDARLAGVDADLPFSIDERALAEVPSLTLETNRGRIDVFHIVSGVGDYHACRARSESFATASGRSILLLGLEALIAAKRAAGRPKDMLDLRELEALLPLTRTEAHVPAGITAASPAAPPTIEELRRDLASYASVQRLRVDVIRASGDPDRRRKIEEALAELPHPGTLALRIVQASRDPALLDQLTPGEHRLITAARHTLSVRHPGITQEREP